MSPGGQQRAQTTGSRRGTKRRRPAAEQETYQETVDASAVGNVQILECDPAGKYVKLQNTSESEVIFCVLLMLTFLLCLMPRLLAFSAPFDLINLQ